jgi:two-component system cell cycle response regulator
MAADETLQVEPPAAVAAPRVLVVDDDELVLTHLSAVIGEAGFQVSTASNAEAALKHLQHEFAPIVILDRNMPGMDGLELCRTIRRTAYPGYVYVVLLTVQDAEEDILAGLGAGADDYVSKRASTAQLLARLRTSQRILSLEHSLKNMVEERQQLAMTDGLTGAHNDRYFTRHLLRELARKGLLDGSLSLIVLDIDDFKQVNDRYGYAAGDGVLKEVVRRIQSRLPRECDWCARVGGEEFVVVLPDTGLVGAGVLAERLRRAIAAEPMQTGAEALPITVSVGVSGMQAFGDRNAVTSESLLRVADECLYRSKEAGGNRVTVATVDESVQLPR